MVASLGINSMAAKVLTEVLFFMISWTVQRYVVFYDGNEAEGSEADRGESGMSRSGRTGGRLQIGYTAVRPKKLRAVRSREETRAEA
jgi:hypothetical protein